MALYIQGDPLARSGLDPVSPLPDFGVLHNNRLDNSGKENFVNAENSLSQLEWH